MQTKTYTTIDRTKTNWPEGPWDHEPDKMQWPDEVTGMPCLAVRHPEFGHWCGYVGLPPGHPLHGVEYNNVLSARAHCGLTFSGACQPSEDEATGICHVPDEGEPHGVWWFGFDCNHANDLAPGMLKHMYPSYRHGNRYYTLEDIKELCAVLAADLLGEACVESDS